jgi:DNA-binding MarR family transcriptional regulator
MPRATDSIALDAYVVDTLLPDLIGHDRRPSAFLVYLVLWRHADAGRASVALSLRELAEATGLSKRAVQSAVNVLVRRRLVALERETPSSVPSYAVLRPWARRG